LTTEGVQRVEPGSASVHTPCNRRRESRDRPSAVDERLLRSTLARVLLDEAGLIGL